MKATFFPMTVVLGNPGFMTRGQLRRLDRAGMTIAAHSWDHHRVDEYAGDDWRIQITEPIRELQRIVGHRIRYFAYPFGLWKPEAFPRLRRAAPDDPAQDRQPRLDRPRVPPSAPDRLSQGRAVTQECAPGGGRPYLSRSD
jgi:peptidoglycan/xylan/chitin deacetylase (PgdA/CDA1 family)